MCRVFSNRILHPEKQSDQESEPTGGAPNSPKVGLTYTLSQSNLVVFLHCRDQSQYCRYILHTFSGQSRYSLPTVGRKAGVIYTPLGGSAPLFEGSPEFSSR